MAILKSPRLCGIYVLQIDRTDKPPAYYVGQTVDFETRRGQHLRAFRRGDHDNSPLVRAFKKYGEAAFSFTFVVEVASDPSEMARREQEVLDWHIAQYGPSRVKNIMRDCVKSHLGVTRRLETRIKMSEAQTGRRRTLEQNEANRQRSLGRIMSDETRQRISEKLKGRPSHPETLRALAEGRQSEKRLANLRAAKAQSTYRHSDETRAKIAETLTGRKQSPELIERRIAALRGRKQSPESIAKRVASRLANARK